MGTRPDYEKNKGAWAGVMGFAPKSAVEDFYLGPMRFRGSALADVEEEDRLYEEYWRNRVQVPREYAEELAHPYGLLDSVSELVLHPVRRDETSYAFSMLSEMGNAFYGKEVPWQRQSSTLNTSIWKGMDSSFTTERLSGAKRPSKISKQTSRLNNRVQAINRKNKNR